MSQQKTKAYELMVKVNDLIMQERYRQNELWGLQRHSPGKWLGILGEEFGEACQAVNRFHFPKDAKPTDAINLTMELIQVAAVAQAWAEQLVEEMQGAEAQDGCQHDWQTFGPHEFISQPTTCCIKCGKFK